MTDSVNFVKSDQGNLVELKNNIIMIKKKPHLLLDDMKEILRLSRPWEKQQFEICDT